MNPKAGKTGRAKFPGAIRRPFYRGDGVNRSHSTDPPFLPEGAGDESAGGDANKKKTWKGYRKTGTGPMSADTEFTLRALRCSLLCRLPTDRASGQPEITLSPSRCVQSKLQFKSSCQILSLFLSLPFLVPLFSLSLYLLTISAFLALTAALSLQAAGIRNTENSSSSTAD